MQRCFFRLCILFIIIYVITVPIYAFSAESQPIYEGIDVSQWQQNIDFAKVKEAGIEIVYIKSSEGNGYIDPYFSRNYEKAKQNGLNIGFYHYVTARSVREAMRTGRILCKYY